MHLTDRALTELQETGTTLIGPQPTIAAIVKATDALGIDLDVIVVKPGAESQLIQLEVI